MEEHNTLIALRSHRGEAICSLIGADHNWVWQAMSYRKSCVSHELVVAKQLISGHAFVQFRRSNYEKYPLAAAEKMPPS